MQRSENGELAFMLLEYQLSQNLKSLWNHYNGPGVLNSNVRCFSVGRYNNAGSRNPHVALSQCGPQSEREEGSIKATALRLVEGNPIRILVGPFKFVVVVSRRQDGSYTAPRFSRTRDERKQGAGLAAGAASYKFPERLVVTAVLYRALALELYDP
ncbi:hypothetical protein HZH68_001595 [Vespula germanica]|uniref:Uncharacterized protein n=1 Tax=Vespula germanica TaxID=30212 RepID=A0A834NVT6_VESGE|nr:hypothetical protein HZH68_001595 [Vespula germanica]